MVSKSLCLLLVALVMGCFFFNPAEGGKKKMIKKLLTGALFAKALKPKFLPLPLPIPIPFGIHKHSHSQHFVPVHEPYPVHVPYPVHEPIYISEPHYGHHAHHGHHFGGHYGGHYGGGYW